MSAAHDREREADLSEITDSSRTNRGAAVTQADREREARQEVFEAAITLSECPGDIGFRAVHFALDAYRDAVAARVRWEQQADAEGYSVDAGVCQGCDGRPGFANCAGCHGTGRFRRPA